MDYDMCNYTDGSQYRYDDQKKTDTNQIHNDISRSVVAGIGYDLQGRGWTLSGKFRQTFSMGEMFCISVYSGCYTSVYIC